MDKKKKNFKAILQYDGTRYRGWQVQGNTERTIQRKLETLLSCMDGETVTVNGAGRTDAGVHAAGQVINFLSGTKKSGKEIQDYMNQYLPKDIVVLSVEEAAPRFHARLNAVSKTYVYLIWNHSIPNVFGRYYMTQIADPLDVSAMRKAAAFLCGTHDYRAFCSLKSVKKSTIRTIEKIEIKKEGARILLFYKGDGFLYHMVRILTGTLVEVGLGQRQPWEMSSILESMERSRAGRLMPPEGLTLLKVDYDKG